jgi:perosamine synthetase
MIPISEPYLSKKAKKYLNNCYNTNWISSQGKYITDFEKKLANYHSVKYCVLTSSCTSALHLSLKSINVGVGDEVICPDLTFIAPANMIKLSGARLRLVDIDPLTLTIDVKKIEKEINKKTKAIMVVHQFGHSADMDPIMKLAKKYNLKIIEDNAESIGGKYKGKKLGTIGDVSTLSFYANKIITTGEGGAILTNSRKIANKCLILRDHGMSKIKKYLHLDLGYNYRITNMQAAIGLSQIEILNSILKKRNNQLLTYRKYLSTIPEIKLRSFESWCSPVHWLTTITLNKKNLRNKLLAYLKKFGIDARSMINPVHEAYHFKKYFKNKDFKNSIHVSKNSLHLPSSTNLKKKQIKFICNKLIKFFNN